MHGDKRGRSSSLDGELKTQRQDQQFFRCCCSKGNYEKNHLSKSFTGIIPFYDLDANKYISFFSTYLNMTMSAIKQKHKTEQRTCKTLETVQR